MANRGDAPVRVRSVRVRFVVDGVRGPLRMFRNGYQSWCPSGVATFGVDVDPSLADRCRAPARRRHHADDGPAPPASCAPSW